MSGSKGIDDVLSAITGARRAQARQSALIREVLGRLVTRDEFNDAMKALADTLSALDDAIEHRTDRLAQQLAMIAARPPPTA